jgi:quercetin dioxygenase-like cupin family protein
MSHSVFKGAAVIAALAISMIAAAPSQSAEPDVQRKVLLRQDMSIPGQELLMVEVTIPVGGREGRHTHAGDLIAYVQDGTLTLDYEGKPETTYKAGDTFYVEAGKIHEGINKSNAPIHVLAAFVSPKGKPLTTQVK